MTQLGVDTDRLANTQPEFTRIADRLEAVRTALEGKLGSLDKCWGQDSTGQAFEGNYLDPSQNLRKGIKDLVDVLKSVADGITTMTKGANRTEQDALELAGGAGRLTNTSFRSPSMRGGTDLPSVSEQASAMRDVLGGA